MGRVVTGGSGSSGGGAVWRWAAWRRLRPLRQRVMTSVENTDMHHLLFVSYSHLAGSTAGASPAGRACCFACQQRRGPLSCSLATRCLRPVAVPLAGHCTSVLVDPRIVIRACSCRAYAYVEHSSGSASC